MADSIDGKESKTEVSENVINSNETDFQQINEGIAELQDVDDFASSKLVKANVESDSKEELLSTSREEPQVLTDESGGVGHELGGAGHESKKDEAPLIESSTCNNETSTNGCQLAEPMLTSSTLNLSDVKIRSSASDDAGKGIDKMESSSNITLDKDDTRLLKNDLSSENTSQKAERPSETSADMIGNLSDDKTPAKDFENTSQKEKEDRPIDTFVGSEDDTCKTSLISSNTPSGPDNSQTLEFSADMSGSSDDRNLVEDDADLIEDKNGDQQLLDCTEGVKQSDLDSSNDTAETPNKVSDSPTDIHSPCSDVDADRTLQADESVTETVIEENVKTPTPGGGASSDVHSGSYTSDLSLSFEYDRPRDYCVKITLPNSQNCPVYALVLCSWDNILGPHAQYVWQTEGKRNFTSDIMNYLSTHTLTSSDQPEDTVDTKMLILKDRGILVTSFLFSGYDKQEKTVFSLSLIVPYVDYQWYLPLHEFCVSRLSMMIGKLRVLQDKYKEEVGDKAVEAFNEDVPKFMNVLTQLKMSSPGPRIQLNETVFAAGLENTLDVQFTRLAIASHLQTCGCSIVVGKTVTEVNMMISTLAMFLSPAERRCCIYLNEGETRTYERDLHLQGFIKDTINLSECMRDIMVSLYPSTLVDMTTLEVRQTLPYNKHAYWRHEVLCRQLQSLWLDSDEPMVYMPIISFQNKCETETLVQNFQREINLLHPHSGVREAYVEQYQRLLDRKAVGLIKYVEEETMKGSKTSRITIKKLKHDLDLNPEGNFRIILARAEKLKPGIYTVVCGNPAQTREPLLQLDFSISSSYDKP